MSGCRISSASSSWSSRTRFASTLSPSSILKLSSACLRSEEHTSELQSQSNLVCRLLLEKKKKLPEADEQDSDRTENASGETTLPRYQLMTARSRPLDLPRRRGITHPGHDKSSSENYIQ